MDVRKTGIWMVAIGAAALAAGLVADAVRHADDPTLAQTEGIFDLSSFPHALFFGGISVAIMGLFLLLVGPALYRATERVTVGRRLAQVGAPLAAIALIAGCATAASESRLGEGSGVEAVDPATGAAITDTAATEDGHSHAGEEEGVIAADEGDHAHGDAAADPASVKPGDVIPGTASGDSPCEIAQPIAASPGQVGTGEGGSEEVLGEHGHRGMVKPYPLTQEERVELEAQMAQARQVVAEFPTVKDAEAGGYHMSTVYVPCIGAHYTNVQRVFPFNPATPSEILYDGTSPDSKIVGLSYLVFNPGGPPEGFAGQNDHWHQHNANGGLCMKGTVVVGGEEMSEADCEARGGRKRELEDIWMVHAWVVPGFECSWGVFAGECPELGGVVGKTAWDEPIAGDDDAGETGVVSEES